jgi:hypothetical protein
MHALHHLICNSLVDRPLLTMDKTLACLNLLQAGLTLGRHHLMDPVVMDHRVVVVSLNHTVTVDHLPTVEMLG